MVTQQANIPPSPPADFIGGHLLSIRNDPLRFFVENMHEYGDLVRLKFGKYDGYQVNDIGLVQQILTADNKIWHKAVVYKTLLADYLGNGLLISDGDFWKRQRKLMQPAFHTMRINRYADTMVDYTAEMLTQWQAGQVRDIAADMMTLTLRIVGQTLFSTDLSRSMGQIGAALDHLLEDIAYHSRNVRWVRLPDWVPTPARVQRKWAVDVLEKAILPIIAERRASGVDTGDLLSMLLMAQDENGEGMSNQQVRDEALTLVLAGHETTANALTWTLYLLSQNHDAEAKLQAEVDSVLNGRKPMLEDLANMPYTELVLKEAMRLYPPAWSFGRQSTEDTMFGDLAIKRRTMVLMIPYAIHRNETYYPEPERFIPERFAPENEGTIPKYAYLPFGGGPRICIGNGFAMMEARLILASIVQRFMLTLQPNHVVEPEPLVTLRPKYGMKMVLSARKSTQEQTTEASLLV